MSKPKARTENKLIETAKRRFQLILDAEEKQRQNERDDVRFMIPENQWTDAAKRDREGSGGPWPSPGRPTLSISQMDQPVSLVVNQMRQAHLGVDIHPISQDATSDNAEMRRGLYHKIEKDSNAVTVRAWAFHRAAIAGRGYYRIVTRYAEENGDDGEAQFDQILALERILYQDSVYFDPTAQMPDLSDARYAFIISWLSESEFKDLYGDDAVPASEESWKDSERQYPNWIKKNGTRGDRSICLVEYFYKTTTTTTKYARKNVDDSITVHDELPEGEEPYKQREIETTILKWARLSAFDVHEESEWDVPMIPIVPVYGQEMQPVDGERRFIGIVNHAKDPQRAYNYEMSTAVETSSLEPRSPWTATMDQIKGYEDLWQQSNRRNFPVLLYNLVRDGTGQALPAPQRTSANVEATSLSLQMAEAMRNGIQATTNTYDPSLGRLSSRERSGKAIQELQDQSEQGSSGYLQNLAEISMPYEARVIMAWMSKVYDRPGRIVRILDLEGNSSAVMVGRPFVEHPESGMPMPAEEAPPGMGQPQQYDLTKGQFACTVSIGRAKDTLRQEQQEALSQLMQAGGPDMALLVGPIFYKHQDWPGHDEIAELMGKFRDMKFPGLTQDPQGAPSPQQVQAMQQQIQMLQQKLQQAGMIIQTKQVEHQTQAQAQIQAEQLKQSSAVAIAKMNNATKIAVARLTAAKASLDSAAEAQEERLALGVQIAHEHQQGALDRQHELNQAVMEHQQALEAAQQAHEQALAQGQQGHEQTLEQGQQAAALAPEPENPAENAGEAGGE